jgi:hypothetical protein
MRSTGPSAGTSLVFAASLDPKFYVRFISDTITVQRALSVALSLILIAATSHCIYGQEPAWGPAQQSTEQIQALVARIALYPDALVAQVLSGATFPDQIALAQNWLQDHRNLKSQELMKEVNKQTWDPSVKALTQFPSVLDRMAQNLAWTSELGEVYSDQSKEVMDAVQVLRAKAKAAGTLQSNAQIKVVQQSASTIIIEPADPQIVYVPQYNPAVIYGTPYVVPGYTASEAAVAGVISFGAGIAVGALMSSGCCSWGYSSWSCGWHGGAVAYGGVPYYGSAAWHGAYGAYGYHGYGAYGAAAYHSPYGSAEGYHGYGAYGGYHTGGAYQTAWGGATTHTGYGPDGAVHTGGSGYNAATGQAYHYGGTSTRYGGTAYHGTTSTGAHYAGGTTAGGERWGGSTSAWGHDDGGFSRAASERGWGSMRASGFGGFHGGFRR